MNRDEKGKFQKGHKMGGRKKLPDDIKMARNLSFEDMCRTVIEIRNLTPEEVVGIDQDKMPLGKRAIMNAYVKLDYRGIKEYEDRLWGKARESVDLSFSNLDIDYKLTEEEINRIREELGLVKGE